MRNAAVVLDHNGGKSYLCLSNPASIVIRPDGLVITAGGAPHCNPNISDPRGGGPGEPGGKEPAVGEGMTDKDLKRAYEKRLEAIARILYDLDPDGIGRSIDAPEDEYSELASKLLPRLWAAKNVSEAAQEIARLIPTAEQALIDALWAARQRIP